MDVTTTRIVYETRENVSAYDLLVSGSDFIDLDAIELAAFDSTDVLNANRTSNENVEIRFTRYGRKYLADVNIEDGEGCVEREVCFYDADDEDGNLHPIVTFQQGNPYNYHTLDRLANVMFALAEGVFAL